ncbi:hypothetical protein H257_16595 [Aphanomyces astaci]|uniref:Uncharacterized protein n=1 Tax=Aphanomyces astaci TaxID=112090 RepID=W4FK36_APHAT|nr:hypothetical protein H257_16595 [Aphanomyces astaci]ETV67221.1 hypothetical protein H257_16595 [Aphanomyces astaci]|eukprot:XP_009843386.1 hypothetical protein H257_16595 [Aphanomyces astaci]
MMIADILTKAIPREQFETLRSKLGIEDGTTHSVNMDHDLSGV